jgi:predicted ATP-binding protein involved in virulence
MKILNFELVNFRGIKRMSLDFVARTSALVGVNGVGKSAVLDALAIALSQLTARINAQPAKARGMSPDDIRVGAEYTRLTVTTDLDEPKPITWAIALNRKAGKHPPERSSDFEGLKGPASLLEMRLVYHEMHNEPVNLPLAVYYDVHRAVLDVPLRVREKLSNVPREAYIDVLGHGGTDFRGFFTWFRNREDDENEKIRDNPNYRDRDLSAVRRAVEQFTQFSDLRIRRKPALRMTVNKAGTELNVMQLSDGEKCMLALVGDLARRLSLLNTKGDDPLEGNGVVLIDEIDLHLHPRWQRTVVASLERTFPNCQFIVTTHSPQVIGELPAESVMLLKNGAFIGHPERSLGLKSGDVLEEFMEGLSRNATVHEELTAIRRAIDDEELAQAQSLIAGLRQRVGNIPDVLEAQSALDSLKWLEGEKD